ncbi:LEAF RUST 10 DISEASE-RESISTANCE LOCUS RECEPTOR-LIKE PROTEIN KINASE-like 1.2 isoform X1 [Oryza brachyantha]|uniref:non-specific serine/threonine protein kinase n=1 Tax=Oryza brachyantha TaxID=4533 RepID=J3L322_ORYBR|nr:LEAF RUST 10 DISEASE-RESISTANCE LOCUS RECEPTOR-LIKE PROTEIN KINASE-like 1.2 isoform X1 [Oryza brachyantha]
MSRLCHHGGRELLLTVVVLLLLLAAAVCRGNPTGDTYDTAMCGAQASVNCGDVTVRYPFYLSNATRALPKYANSSTFCGYPGLEIICDGGGRAVMRLGDDNYTVSRIDYAGLTVSLADADVANGSCPLVSHNVTIPPPSSLRLADTVGKLVFFFRCAFGPAVGDAPPKPPTIHPLTCSESSEDEPRPSFLIPASALPPKDWYRGCEAVYDVPVLGGSLPSDANDPAWRRDGYVGALRKGFQVSWDRSKQCAGCELTSGKCGYDQHGKFFGCLCADGLMDSDGCSKISDSTLRLAGSKRRTKIIAVAVAIAGTLALVAGATVFVVRKRKYKKVSSSSKLLKYSGSGGTPRSMGAGDMESGSVKDLQTHLFSYEELEEATDSFNDNRELGDGGFGTVYKGILRDGRVVAVKRLYNNSYRRVEQFVNEAAILSRLRHPNLVMFYGCTSSQSRELLLVYEFVANGTVADHLHGQRAQERALSWPLRLSIAVESAAALTYLHAIEPPIVHRDVKTTNILLDSDFHVKVADFGLSRLFPLDVTHVSTAPQGTPGYVDPEYHQCYQLTDKSDVYSFGVVLVELISSKPAVDITRQRNEINLAGMAINRIQKSQLEELVDLELGYESDPATKKMMTMVAELAFRCLQQNGEMRPPIKEVLEVLRGIQELCVAEKDGGKDKKDLDPPLSPDTVHVQWDSRQTTPNPSQ